MAATGMAATHTSSKGKSKVSFVNNSMIEEFQNEIEEFKQ